MTTYTAMAEPHRRKILGLLRDGERTVNDLVGRLNLSQPGVSKHLKILREAGLVEVRREGRERWYGLRAKPLAEVDAWLEPYRVAWSARLDALEQHLDEGSKTMTNKAPLPRPDLSDRRHQLTIECDMRASPAAIYRAWTEDFDSWFASPGKIRMRAEEDEPFFFETEHEGQRHSHHGRFLSLKQDRRVELTWVTGMPGTAGAETVVSVELDPTDTGTHLRLTHAGFYDHAGVKQHEVWPTLLAGLDERLATSP